MPETWWYQHTIGADTANQVWGRVPLLAHDCKGGDRMRHSPSLDSEGPPCWDD